MNPSWFGSWSHGSSTSFEHAVGVARNRSCCTRPQRRLGAWEPKCSSSNGRCKKEPPKPTKIQGRNASLITERCLPILRRHRNQARNSRASLRSEGAQQQVKGEGGPTGVELLGQHGSKTLLTCSDAAGFFSPGLNMFQNGPMMAWNSPLHASDSSYDHFAPFSTQLCLSLRLQVESRGTPSDPPLPPRLHLRRLLARFP